MQARRPTRATLERRWRRRRWVEGQTVESARTAPTAGQGQPVDSLGRSTPQGAVTGFMEAVQQGNLERAAEYLDSRLRPSDRQLLAEKLGVVLDRKLLTGLSHLSSNPEGDLQDRLPTNRDRVGELASPSGSADIFVDRVQRGQDNPIWLFSSATLQEIPRLYRDIQPIWIESHVPEQLRTIRRLSIPVYRWIALLFLIPLLFGLATLASRILAALLRRLLGRITRDQDDHRLASPGPLRLLVLALTFYGASFFGLTLTARHFWQGVAGTCR